LKEIQLRVGLVSNSNFLNTDVGITGLVISIFNKQINVSPLIYFPLYFLILLCFRQISCDVLHCLVDIVYINLCVSLEVHCIYFYEIDYLLREISLNSLILLRPVW
jgi:hypothetical protein